MAKVHREARGRALAWTSARLRVLLEEYLPADYEKIMGCKRERPVPGGKFESRSSSFTNTQHRACMIACIC